MGDSTFAIFTAILVIPLDDDLLSKGGRLETCLQLQHVLLPSAV